MQQMEEAGIYPGVDYRIMTITDRHGKSIFSTDALPTVQVREAARLALRPVGWKLHQQMWDKRGKKIADWPVQVEVEANLLSSSAMTRFNLKAFVPRLTSLIALDALAVVFLFVLATSPLPLALVGREFVSLYEIQVPSASMNPTLERGDVLVVEKFPGIYDRTRKGDVVLFKPPPSLQEIIGRSSIGSSNPLGGESLFVKRIVGMPGDKKVVMDANTNEVSIDDSPAVGPDRNLCDDEPLNLIDKLLVSGKGKDVEVLGQDDVYVLGDCKAVSVDSRVFGKLLKSNIVGKPIARIWPLNRIFIGSL
jgi:signal peptidase I